MPQLKSKVLIASALAIIFVVALSIRILPVSYGVYMLNEHDPYYQYYMANFVVERGWQGFVDWFSWGTDHRFWNPWGRNVSTTSFPGVAFAGAFLYLLAKPFGLDVDLMTFCCFLPPIFGAIASIVIFFLGREVEDTAAGLYSSIFLAINAAYISRTGFGFFDDESVGILMLIIALLFYVRALKKGSLVSGVIAGLALGYMGLSWGAYVYPLNLLAIFTLILIIMKRYSRNLLYASFTTILVSMLVAAITPEKGLKYIVSPTGLLPLLALVTLVFCEARKLMPHRVRTPASIAYVVAIIAGAVAYLSLKGVGISLRYLSAAFPWIRSTDPLVVSVAEHSMTTWSHFFLQFGFILVLGVAGLYFLVQRLNDVDVLFVLLGLLTAYVATNMVRLNLLLAPVFSLLAGVACSRVTGQLLKHFSLSKQEGRKRALKIPRSHVVLGLFAVLIVLTPAVTGFSTIDPRTGLPTNLAYADSPILMSRDWLSALEWMRENLPEDAVVASWWDHGYWIAIVGNRTSVCDNSTFNGTQIRLIARAFLSNETEALKIFKQLGVTHVVVHGIFYDLGSRILGIPMWISWGHDYVAISYSAMASIAGFNVDDYIELDNFGLLSQWVPVPRGPKAAETTLYRLIYNPVGNRFLFLKELNVTVTEEGYLRIMGYELLNIPPPEHFKLVYASEPNQYVMIYEVLYED